LREARPATDSGSQVPLRELENSEHYKIQI